MGNIINGDCSEELVKISSEQIDLIVIDPPYEINFQNLDWDKKELNWTFLFSQFQRILKPTGNLIIFQGWSKVCETIQEGNKFFE